MVCLGYANGWKEKPPIVKEAEAKGYRLTATTEGHCLTRYECSELDFYYFVDSSD